MLSLQSTEPFHHIKEVMVHVGLLQVTWYNNILQIPNCTPITIYFDRKTSLPVTNLFNSAHETSAGLDIVGCVSS